MAKRILKLSTDWVALEKRVPPEQLPNFWDFKRKSEGYVRRMMANPADPPPIDWDSYKKIIPEKELVEKFKAAYSSFKVPYPEDKVTPLVEKQWEEVQKEMEAYRETTKKKIELAKQEIAKIEALPKYEDMTMEMVYDMYPESAVDFVAKPTFWPHTEDEQLGYVDPTRATQPQKPA